MQRDGTKVWRINITSIFNENFVKAKKSFRWTNLEGWNALKEYFGLDIYLQVNFDKQKNLFIINKIKIECWLNLFENLFMWKGNIRNILIKKYSKDFTYLSIVISLSSIHFNVLKLF